jgi:flagellar basal body-associated protein FliL
MKKVLILIVVLVLLGGGAVGAMAVFGIGPFAKPTNVAAPPPPTKKVMYVDMQALSIPVFIPDQKPRQVFMTLRLETNEDVYKKVTAMEPRIRDVLLTDLHNVLPDHLKDRKTTDLTQLKPRMIADIAKVIGPGVVTDVLVIEIFER